MSAISKEILHSLNRQECYEHGVGVVYDDLIVKGNTPAFAHMLAMKQPPGTKGSEQAFWSGKDRKHDCYGFGEDPPWFREMQLAKARAAGISIEGKWYMGQIADTRGVADPGAWVSSTSDVLATCRKRNLNITGIVNHQGEMGPPPPDIPLSEELIREGVQEAVEADPGLLQRKPMKEIREAVVDKHGAPSRFRKKKDYTPKPGFVDLDTVI